MRTTSFVIPNVIYFPAVMVEVALASISSGQHQSLLYFRIWKRIPCTRALPFGRLERRRNTVLASSLHTVRLCCCAWIGSQSKTSLRVVSWCGGEDPVANIGRFVNMCVVVNMCGMYRGHLVQRLCMCYKGNWRNW